MTNTKRCERKYIDDINHIERKIACHKISVAQVFTQMRQIINSVERECEYRSTVINTKDETIIRMDSEINDAHKDLVEIDELITVIPQSESTNLISMITAKYKD